MKKGKLKQPELDIIVVKKTKALKGFEKILNIFNENTLKAVIIAQMNVKSVSSKYLDKSFTKPINKLEKKYGIQNIATNYAIVILVSAMETLLRDAFVFLVNHNKNVTTKISQSDRKIELKKVSGLLNKQSTIGDILAEDYNFQNLDSINKAYQWLYDIDIFKIIESTKLHSEGPCPHCRSFIKIYGNPIKIIKEVIDLRHRIIHESYIKKGFSMSKLGNCYNTVDFFINHFWRMLVMKTFKYKIIPAKSKLGLSPKKMSGAIK